MELYTLLGITIIAWTIFNAAVLYWKSSPLSDHRLFALSITSYAIFIGSYLLLIEGKFYFDVPWMFRYNAPMLFLSPPLFYFYLRYSLKNQTMSRVDFLHFIPTLIVFLSYVPVYLLDNQSKFRLIEEVLANPAQSHLVGAGLIPPAVMTVVKLVFFAFYSGLIGSLMINYKEYFGLRNAGFHWKKVAAYFFIGISISFMIYTSNQLGGIFELWESKLLKSFGFASTYFLIVSINCYLVFYQDILFKESISPDEKKDKGNSNEGVECMEVYGITSLQVKEKDSALSKVNAHKLEENLNFEDEFQRIDYYIKKHFIYQQKNISLGQLSKQLNIPERKLSSIIRLNTDKGYNDFINSYRAEFAKLKIEEGYLKTYTIEALSELAGFNSRVTFFHSFKKLVGICPRDYWKDYCTMEK